MTLVNVVKVIIDIPLMVVARSRQHGVLPAESGLSSWHLASSDGNADQRRRRNSGITSYAGTWAALGCREVA